VVWDHGVAGSNPVLPTWPAEALKHRSKGGLLYFKLKIEIKRSFERSTSFNEAIAEVTYIHEAFKNCEAENFKIEKKTHVANIFRIPMITREDAFIVRSLTMISFHLGEPGNSGSNQCSEIISGYYERETNTICDHMRTGTNEAHVADKYI